jgi:hypothetical protein
MKSKKIIVRLFASTPAYLAADFRMVAKLLAKSSTLFTGECPSEYPEGCRTKERFSKRRARKADSLTFADTWGDSKTSNATATENCAEPKIQRSWWKSQPSERGAGSNGDKIVNIYSRSYYGTCHIISATLLNVDSR